MPSNLTGLTPDTPIVSLGSFHEVALVNPVTRWILRNRCSSLYQLTRTALTSFQQDRLADLD